MMARAASHVAVATSIARSAPIRPARWIECPDCGLLQGLPAPLAGHRRRCRRCGSSFGQGIIRGDAALALAVTAVVLFLLANVFPLIAINIIGRGQSIALESGARGLADHQMVPLALFVLVISAIAPFGRIVALGYVLTHLRGASRPNHLVPLLHFAERMRPWAMLDVFLIGALIALTKLHDLATLDIGVGFWALGLLVIVLAGFDMTIDRRMLWDLVSPPHYQDTAPVGGQCIGCRECGLVQPIAARCSRCREHLRRRKTDSRHRATALVLTGFVLYVPANVYPVFTIISFGQGAPATILDGVMELMNGSDWPLAVIVFTASIAVPLLKLLGLGFLLLSIQFRSRDRLVDRTRLYRLIELVSRWSTVDVFVAALLTALVTLGNIATIEPGMGVLAFGAVVFITMLATECFDPRLMWDVAGANDVSS